MRDRITPLAIAVAIAASGALLAEGPTAGPATPHNRAIIHLLNRIGFGPTPGQVERVRSMGLEAYIASQLHPERVPNDGLGARLTRFTTLTMTSRELAAQYFLPAMRERLARQQQQGREAAPPGERMTPERRDAVDGERRVLLELAQQKLLRAIYSERQLEEVMVDFWFNHFNVSAGKGVTRIYLTEYERDVIRPRVFGRFRDLLGAVAESPAMLFYLDNWQSSARNEAGAAMRPDAKRRGMPQRAVAQNRPRGINENYARELMELHTLGVDGGYTQRDVQEVARAFTGWTIQSPRQGGGFLFDRRRHDDGEKVVLGVKIPAGGGKRDGEQVLDILAEHPSAAAFISAKLARRFVSDEPPRALVERAAGTFRRTDGDIREVLRTILTSPEFSAASSYRAKVKTPFEFVASAVRATGAEVQTALPLVQALRQLGMPPYLCGPPTGYADTADAWVNTGALLDRMNFAVRLARNLGASSGGTSLVGAERIASDVMGDDLAETTRAAVARGSTESQRVALLLGSPDFQKR